MFVNVIQVLSKDFIFEKTGGFVKKDVARREQ